jgi:hypothetical protein
MNGYVHVTIEEITLVGVAVDDVVQFRSDLTAALTALATVHRGQLAGGTTSLLRGPSIDPAPDSLGASVATSVWHTLARNPARRPGASTSPAGGGAS